MGKRQGNSRGDCWFGSMARLQSMSSSARIAYRGGCGQIGAGPAVAEPAQDLEPISVGGMDRGGTACLDHRTTMAGGTRLAGSTGQTRRRGARVVLGALTRSG